MRSIDAYNTISKPVLTSKSYILGKNNVYVFSTCIRKDKTKVKKALEILFKTQVLKLRTAKIVKKEKKYRRVGQKRKGRKKFFITVNVKNK